MTQTVNISMMIADNSATLIITRVSHTTTAQITATVCTFTGTVRKIWKYIFHTKVCETETWPD